MPKLLHAIPKYRRHRASGQAIVTIGGTDHYLGPYGTKASHAEYDRLIGEWVANGRQLPTSVESALTIAELIKRYRVHVLSHYVKNGRPTSERHDIAAAMKPLREIYGKVPVTEFGPLALKAVRDRYIEKGFARSSINKHVHRIRRMFRWAVENEIVLPSILQGLQAVAGLRKGKTEAREPEPITPVADEVVDATLPYLGSVTADMVRFQRLTGCRPAEVCMLRPGDIDRSGDVWQFVPREHKTEHHDKSRIIVIGPRAQELLRPYLLRAPSSYCFSPIDSERKRRQTLRENRKTPLGHGNRPGTNRACKPKVTIGECYTTGSYRKAIHRGCDDADATAREAQPNVAADVRLFPRWSPNRLRHAMGTQISYPAKTWTWPYNAVYSMRVGKNDYAACSGDGPWDPWLSAPAEGPTTLADGDRPNYPWIKLDVETGIVFQRSTIRPSDITDGLSKTYLLGEKYIDANQYESGVDNADDQSGFLGYSIDVNRWTMNKSTTLQGFTVTNLTPQPDRRGVEEYSRFGSAHSNVCIMALADGAVPRVSFTVDPETHRRLGNRRDGLTINFSSL
jgi:integrase